MQRELAPNLVVEAAYVGSRGVWWNSNYMVNPNLMTPALYAAAGLDVNNPADQQLIISPINSPLAVQRGYNKLPYPGFPPGATVGQSLRPFPQFLGLTNFHYSPTGNTWYDSLQADTVAVAHGGTARALMVALGIETPASASDLYIEQGVVYVFGDGDVTKYS